MVGKHFAETSTDTRTVLYFKGLSGENNVPLIENVSAIGVDSGHRAVREEAQYYLFVQRAATDAVARKTTIGPVDARTFRLKRQQPNGDTILRLSTEF